ncbi:hypothetical protein [Reyranella sp.]
MAISKAVTLEAAPDRYGLPVYVTKNGAGAVEKPEASGESKQVTP